MTNEEKQTQLLEKIEGHLSFIRRIVTIGIILGIVGLVIANI